MSKSATVAATIVLTSAVQGEQVQIDIGPYATANINVLPNVSSSSPGFWYMPTTLKVGENNISLTLANGIAPLPIYLVVAPIQSTSGASLFLQGASTDTGVQISSTNPSFIPPLATTSGGDGPIISPPVVWMNTSQTCQLEIAWV